MTRTAGIVLSAALVLVLSGCGKMPGSNDDKLDATEVETAEAVLAGILERLGTEYEEHGPEFVRRVPVVKQEVLVAHGFNDWRDFSAQVRALDPSLDLRITRQITRRIDDLLATPREPEAAETAGEEEE